MLFIPTEYRHHSITNLIDKYINHGFTAFDQLDPHDQDKLASTCINALGSDAYEMILDQYNANQPIQHFSRYLLTADMDDAYEMLNKMKKNTISYLTDILNDLFSERTMEWRKTA